MVVWVVGLSGSGKTTLGRHVVEVVRSFNQSLLHLDGDEVRDLFGNDLAYSIEDRRVNADRICKLSRFFDDQKVDVVVTVLSIFQESRDWCRANLSAYKEVYVRASMETLFTRDSKKIYSRYSTGSLSDVAGLDLDFPDPSNSADLIIDNNGTLDDFLNRSRDVVNFFVKERS